MTIGDVFLRLRAETAEFVKDAQKEGAKAGDAAGKTFGDRLKANAGKIVGSALAAGFAVATKGALEAEAAQGKFMAATGKSREEAKKFVSQMDSLAGTSGAVGRTFEEIAGVGTTVEQQFKTTGQETRNLTDDILKFSKVTGQDANDAAGQLEDTLSAFGLEAKDAAGLMDQLVASNQTFGTDAGPETLGVLQSMAPALQAMGEDLDAGVGLLNLFETAGLDAGAAQAGLKKAIKELKPGQTLDDLIAQIGAIEDPTLRAQEAIEIFGGKAGPGLALAIEPGMTSLDEFEVHAGDVAGTVGTASEDMLTLGDRIKGWADKALAGAREVGNEFGPALTGLASLASLAAPFAKGLKGLFSGLIEKVLPTAIATGAATGAAEGEAHVAASTGTGMVSKFLAKFGLMTGAKVTAAGAAGALEGAAEGEATAVGATGPKVLTSFLTKLGLMTGAKVTAAEAVGTVVGAAEGEAQVAAATGPGVVKSLFARIAAMAIPLAPAGTTVGTAVGGAMALGVVAGLFAGGIAIHETIGDFFAFPGTKEFIARKGQEAAMDYAKGYDEATRQKVGQIMHDAVRQALEEGATEKDALLAGEKTVIAYLAAYTNASNEAARVGRILQEAALHPTPETLAVADDAGTVTALTWNSAFAKEYEQGYKDLAEQRLVERILQTSMEDAHRIAALGGAQTPGEFSQGLRSTFDTVRSGFKDLVQLMKDALSPAKQIAELEGIATSKKLAQALHDGRPEVRSAAQQVTLDALAQLHQLQPGSAAIGTLTTKLLAGALPNERPYLQDQINKIVGTVSTPLSTLPGIAANTGTKITNRLAGAISGTSHVVYDAAYALARKVSNILRVDSPAKEGPWHERGGPLAWMARLGIGIPRELADAMRAGVPSLSSTASALARAAMPALGGLPALTPTYAALPSGIMSSPLARTRPVVMPSSVGGDTYNIPVTVHGLPLRAETPAEVARQMSRVASLGELPKRKNR